MARDCSATNSSYARAVQLSRRAISILRFIVAFDLGKAGAHHRQAATEVLVEFDRVQSEPAYPTTRSVSRARAAGLVKWDWFTAFLSSTDLARADGRAASVLSMRSCAEKAIRSALSKRACSRATMSRPRCGLRYKQGWPRAANALASWGERWMRVCQSTMGRNSTAGRSAGAVKTGWSASAMASSGVKAGRRQQSVK